MDNPPAFDRTILIPISLGGFSIVGIIVVLLIGRSLSSPPEVPVTPSSTRFQYLYLGTEPAITTPLVEESEVAPTEDPFGEPTEEGTPSLFTPTSPAVSTPIILTPPNTPTGAVQPTNTLPATATSASAAPLNPGTYDNVDSRLVYNGWNPTNSGGTTLHVSVSPGSTVSFRFIGTQLRLRYQGGSTLGQLSIVINNGQSVTLSQSSGNEWASTPLPNGTHTVLITHTGGGSVNLDEVIIPTVSTTPTPTPTQTP